MPVTGRAQAMIGWTPAPLAASRELQRPEQIGPVRHRHGRHARVRRQLADLARLDRAFQQRIGRADPQMDEALLTCGCGVSVMAISSGSGR